MHVYSKWFWRWCITLRITGFSDFVHRPVFCRLENTTFGKLNLSPSSGEGETPALLGPLGLTSVIELFTAANVLRENRDSSVGKGMGYGTDGQGSITDRGGRFVSTPQCPYQLWGPPILIQWVPGTLSLCIKQPGREADHSSLCNAEVKDGWAIPPLPHTSSWHGA
jgi:hypothetical protein